MSLTEKTQPTGRFFSHGRLSRVRIVSGLILFAYVLLHFSNHALGLISLSAMSEMGSLMKTVIRFGPISYILYAALAAHTITALWQIFERRTLLSMPLRDWMQLLTAIAIPLLLITHIMGTRYAAAAYGLNDSYSYIMYVTFISSPLSGVMNVCGLMAVWVHSCIGLHMWLRMKRWYSVNWRNFGLLLAGVWPVLSLTGYLSAGREITPLSTDGEWLGPFFESLNLSSDAMPGWISADTIVARNLVLAVLIFVFIARLVRNRLAQRAGNITVDYLDGPTIQQPVGHTLLEMSRNGGVPHASVCGGRGRCSTCRVQVINHTGTANPPSEMEQRVLERVRAPNDVRLACQFIPKGNMKIMRILPADSTLLNSASHEPWATGEERVVAVLFADIREFTKTSENKLPFDVVYLINQFSSVMGQAIERHNGRIDKFLGDGLMAIFGIDSTPQEAARDAIAAAAEMRVQLNLLNERLKGDLSEPMRMGIGIHTGPVVLGNMGYGASRGLTAIGDTVNTASRLEAETKAQKCVVCFSIITAERAGIIIDDELKRHISVRGRQEKLDIFALDDEAVEQLRSGDDKRALVDHHRASIS